MERTKRFFYYLLINVLVSASTTLLVLYWWDYTHPQPTQLAPVTPIAANSAQPGSGTPAEFAGTSLAATPTPTVQTPEAILLGKVEEYEVESGDTLGLIAEKFDVSIEDIMRANQITDPNSLAAGMLLYIPIGPQVTVTHTPEPSPTSTLAGTPGTLSAPVEARLIVNSVIGAGDLASEQVFLTRLGTGDLPLGGWKLEDEDGNVFVFPQLDLFQGGAVIIWTKSGTNTAVDLYWGLSAAVWQPGESVVIRDAQGKVHTQFTIP